METFCHFCKVPVKQSEYTNHIQSEKHIQSKAFYSQKRLRDSGEIEDSVNLHDAPSAVSLLQAVQKSGNVNISMPFPQSNNGYRSMPFSQSNRFRSMLPQEQRNPQSKETLIEKLRRIREAEEKKQENLDQKQLEIQMNFIDGQEKPKKEVIKDFDDDFFSDPEEEEDEEDYIEEEDEEGEDNE